MNRSLPDIPKEWIQQARLADEAAIEKIYSKTYPKAYTIAYYSLGGTNKFQDEAQSITQDSLRKAFEKLSLLKDDDKFAPWMYTILNNSIRDYFRSNKNKDYQTNTFSELDSEDFRDNYEESIADDSVAFSPEANMNTELIAQGLRECLDQLPDNQRFALMMQMYQQLTTKEIAKQMEVEENTVKSWIRRAKLSIKDRIEELRSQNKSFYGVAPLPFLAWMLDQELKSVPTINAKTFADGVVLKIKADTMTPPIPKKHTNASTTKGEAVKKVRAKPVSKVATSTTGKVAAGMGVKVAAGVAAFSVAAFGGYQAVDTIYNKPQEAEKTKVVSNKQETKEEKKKDGFEKVDSYKDGVYRMTADLPVYNTRSKDDPYGKTIFVQGDSKIKFTRGIYKDKDGNYWAQLRKGYYVCVKDKDGEYLGEYLGEMMTMDEFVDHEHDTDQEREEHEQDFFKACGFDEPVGLGGVYLAQHDDEYYDREFVCTGKAEFGGTYM